MAYTEYIVEKVAASGKTTNVPFSSLTDINRDTVPSPFSAAPIVGIVASYQKTQGYISAITTTGFTITRKGRPVGGETMRFNIKIYGDS